MTHKELRDFVIRTTSKFTWNTQYDPKTVNYINSLIKKYKPMLCKRVGSVNFLEVLDEDGGYSGYE